MIELKAENIDSKALIEAAIFASGRALALKDLAKLSGLSEEEAGVLADELTHEYAARRSGIELRSFDDKYVMQVSASLAREVVSIAPREIEAPLIRTLAIIASRQPITQSHLARVRGNKSYSHVKELARLGLVRAEKRGRTKVLTTTKGFAEYFGLPSDSPDFIKREVLRSPKPLGLSRMYKSLGLRLGLDFIIVNPYQPGDDDLEKLKEIQILVIAPGYSMKVREHYSGVLIEARVRTLSQLKESAERICQACGQGSVEELSVEIDALIEKFKERAAGARAIRPLMPMIEDLARELGISIREDGVLAAPDYAKLDAAIAIPTHQPYDMDIVDRIKQRYEVLLAGLA